jgi:hypothetical protein
VVAWIVDDTGFPKKGSHSVGVTRQYCGQVGEQESCRIAVSLSVTTWDASLPIGYRLYLPRTGPRVQSDGKGQKCPKRWNFRPNRRSPWNRFAQQSQRRWPAGWYWPTPPTASNTEFREGLTQLELQYVVICGGSAKLANGLGSRQTAKGSPEIGSMVTKSGQARGTHWLVRPASPHRNPRQRYVVSIYGRFARIKPPGINEKA